MFDRRIAVTSLFMLCATLSFALDQSSYRIRSLGSNFNGLVADEYTDVIANPARLSDVNKASEKKYSLNGKAGNAGSPLTFALFAKKQWALLGEASLNESNNATTSTSLTSLPWDVHTTIAASKYVADSYDGGLMQDMHAGNDSFGFAVFPSRTFTASELSNEYRDIHVNAATQAADDWATTISHQATERETLNTAVNFGFYGTDENGAETDVIARVLLSQTKTTTSSDTLYHASIDPDGNGRDRYNTVITTNNYIWTSASATSQEEATKPTAKIGFGLEYRSRSTTGGAFLAGCSWQPDENKVELTRTASSTQMRGLTVSSTTTSSTAYDTTSNAGATYAAYAAVGSSKKLFDDRLMIAAAFRGDFSYRDATRSSLTTVYTWEQSTTKTYATTLGLSLGAEYTPFSFVAFRLGVSPQMNKSMTTQEVTPAMLSAYRVTSDAFAQSVMYTAGFGITPLDTLSVDFYTQGQVLDMGNFRMQVKYLF